MMQTKPLVSIIIPAFNAEKYIEESIRSALSQTWPNLEVIVVNDGSSDQTENISHQFSTENVKIVSQENLGASAARNRGLREAKGDFIQYLDADDLLDKRKIELQMELLHKGDNLIVAGEWARFRNQSHEAVFAPQKLWREMDAIEWLVCSWNDHLMMHPAAWLMSHNLAKSVGKWDEALSLNDDGEYFCRAILIAKRVLFCFGARSYYRTGIPGSLSGSNSPAAWSSAYRAIDLSVSRLLQLEDSYKTRQASATAYQRFVYESYPLVPGLRKEAEARIKMLGGTQLKPTGGPVFHVFSRLLGWESAKSLQSLAYKNGYRRVFAVADSVFKGF